MKHFEKSFLIIKKKDVNFVQTKNQIIQTESN